MSSQILFNLATKEIIWSIAQAKGLPKPNKKSLCKSARIQVNDYDKYSLLEIDKHYTALEAKDNLRIVVINNYYKVVEKPTLKLSYSNTTTNRVKLTVKLVNTLDQDNFKEVNLKLAGVKFTIQLNNNQGTKVVELPKGRYQVVCIDDIFISEILKIRVV
ncbi:hypothetical protein [Orenia marismortui]|uniref:Uncharacterized protein n=1 Tax=Orenia marismortui TaxID=46469 RepID=A0A4V3GX60_9FIRM|nr:hypothetical protein [Orenia marismortui]TDX46589.1 hypothetical protein C7959_1394 [Orenia marismortui]